MRSLPRRASQRNLSRVTVITITHDCGRHIERTLCSVIDQGYDDLEHIVVDAGSDDETLPIIQHYDDELAHWHSRKGLTPGAMINHALRLATGHIVCIVRGGDLLLPGAIEDALREMAQPGGPKWIVGHTRRIGDRDEHLGVTRTSSAVAFEEVLTQEDTHLPLEAGFFRRDVLLQAGGFDETLTHGYAYEMTCRLLTMDIRPRVLDRQVVAVRESQLSDADATIAVGEQQLEIAERYAHYVPMSQQYLLTRNLTERRRIFDAATREAAASDTRRFYWMQMLKRPEWLASAKYRAALLNGVLEPVTASHQLAA